MNSKDTKKGTPEKDIELPSVESEIENWCKVTEDDSDTKSADDLVIDAWCQSSQTKVKGKEKTKK